MIAHRLSTVVSADQVVALKGLTVLEHGAHEELKRKDGYYASLVKRQTRGLIHSESE